MAHVGYAGGALRELLVHLLLSQDDGTAAAAKEIASRGAWSEVVALADEWHALPRLNQRLAAFVTAPPQPGATNFGAD